ncbi:hypothetical protein RIF29_14193 [Crotalaria pallida]|uniref:Uncharacterized protein n=1 Tax=Crotalaria pallida TaxID=3830 RepID=A0AAN9FAV9_CROPI
MSLTLFRGAVYCCICLCYLRLISEVKTNDMFQLLLDDSSTDKAVYSLIFLAVDPRDISSHAHKPSNPIVRVRSKDPNAQLLKGKDVCFQEPFSDIRRNLITHFDSASNTCNASSADMAKEDSSIDCALHADCSIPSDNCDPQHVLHNFLSTP